MRFPRSSGPWGARAGGPRSCTPTKGTMPPTAARRVGTATWFRALRGAASRAASGWAAIGGWWNALSPGSAASAGCESGTNAAPTSISPSFNSAARSSAYASCSTGFERRSKERQAHWGALNLIAFNKNGWEDPNLLAQYDFIVDAYVAAGINIIGL